MVEITSDLFHQAADQTYACASEILGIADSQDTGTDPVKAGLRHKIGELGRLLDDMRRFVGVPVASTDTPPLPVTKADLEKLDQSMRDIRRLHSMLTLFSASEINDPDKIDEAIVCDVIHILRDIVSGIWDSVDVAILSIRNKLADAGQLEGLK